jgi:hypothetical protein
MLRHVTHRSRGLGGRQREITRSRIAGLARLLRLLAGGETKHDQTGKGKTIHESLSVDGG